VLKMNNKNKNKDGKDKENSHINSNVYGNRNSRDR